MFGRLLRAEWTKLRSVPRWLLALAAALVLTVLMGMLTSSGSGTNTDDREMTMGPGGDPVKDDLHFVHQPLRGDGTITAKVRDQSSKEPWAQAGLMIKASATRGASYAAIMVTPGHGIRLQTDFTEDEPGGRNAPWLRLTRTGKTVTGYASDDGVTWREVGTMTPKALPQQAEMGLYVASPNSRVLERGIGSSTLGERSTENTATFSDVTPSGTWKNTDLASLAGSGPGKDFRPPVGKSSESAGVFTVTGSGVAVPEELSDERIRLPLTGAIAGLIAIAALGVLFMTSEYRRGMIRTTFAVSPGRGRVLAAKAIVLGSVTFAVGLAACTAAVLIAQPSLRDNGFTGPFFLAPAWNADVLRAIVGSAGLLALVAVLGLALGAILRRSAPAIALLLVTLIVPPIAVGALPLSAAQWVIRATPAAGFSIQATVPRYDHVDSLCLPEDACSFREPWAGFGVLLAYAVVMMLVAVWLLRRRDA